MVAACSTPKYTYYFDKYAVKNAKEKAEVNSQSVEEVIASSEKMDAYDYTLMASTSKETFVKKPWQRIQNWPPQN